MQCRIDLPKEKRDEAADLTVGKVFHLVCEGEWPEMKPDSLELRLEKEDQYKLKLLKFDFTNKTEGTLTVTSYRPGQHHLKAVQLVDSEHSVILGDLDFTVNSVMNPQEPVAEPFGPFGPFQLSLPIWYPLSILLVIAGLCGYFLYRWKIRRDKRNLLAEMRLSDSAQEPYFQFYSVIRKLQRNYSYFSGDQPAPEETAQLIEDLNSAYKIYLARHFQVPTLKWSERRILSDLKKTHPNFYEQFRLEVRKSLAELSRAMEAKNKMTGKDCEQLLDLLRKQIDKIEAWVKGKGK